MTSYLWRKYSEYLYTKWEKTILWDMIDPYRRPKSFKPLISIYVAAFYTGVIGSAITEQLYKESVFGAGIISIGFLKMLRKSQVKMLGNRHLILEVVMVEEELIVYLFNVEQEKYWEEHPGEAVPLMKPKFYYGPWKVLREDHAPKQ
ncbi:hypothetical protein BVC80_9005g38 [Macleaya cordata]|uniref:Uncharacterized protein n=1 Tax=Macleaya cordata TaxID=56857 RepID=A0A200QLS1_MACCD|nr:hypothetical protein BVC80_9005g38 [Macleaya cordata]